MFRSHFYPEFHYVKNSQPILISHTEPFKQATLNLVYNMFIFLGDFLVETMIYFHQQGLLLTGTMTKHEYSINMLITSTCVVEGQSQLKMER